MPNNYILLETIALTQSAASVTFDNLPTSGYTDLKIVVSGRSDRNVFSWTNIKVQFNGSASGYTYRNLLGDGSTASSVNNTNDGEGSTGIMVFSLDQANSTASTFGNAEIYIPNYRSSNNKSVSADGVMELNGTNASIGLTAGLWSNTAAITSITLTPQISGSTFNFVANSTFSLYGIAALGTTPVTAPKAFGGNSIENDGTYWIHTFTSSGVFTPQTGLNCDYLVVAGGGGGGGTGNNSGGGYPGAGGGGAGGYRTSIGGTPLTLTATNYAVTVGAGGAGKFLTGGTGTSGNNSVFSTITSAGGGGGASHSTGSGAAGGSGGGASTTDGAAGGAGNTPSVTPSQGNNGGAHPSSDGAAGGGGASAAGSANSGVAGGAGGAGTANSISGSSVTYAGGGGGGSYSGGAGGAGGAGGGGTGGTYGSGGVTDGTANLGGGGGGAGQISPTSGLTGGSGGSGIVIIRYPIA